MVSEQGRRVFITQMEKVENRLMLDSIDHSFEENSIQSKMLQIYQHQMPLKQQPHYCPNLPLRYLLLNFIDWLTIKLDLFILGLYIRQMRYQVKSYRSISYAQPAKDSKENKENNNISNLPSKPNRHSRDYQLNPCKLKLQHKITDVTDCSVSSLPKRPFGEELKTAYTNQICRDYSEDILMHLCQTSSPQTDILTRHEINSSLRSKMVDWMIEVLSSYKMSEETFFRSQHFMDAYLKRCPTRLQVKDLHLVGVTAMFAAAKYEEIHPLKLSVIYDKIARKKFKKSEILQMESQIIEALEFKLQAPSVYDICRHVIQEMNLPLPEASSKYLAKILLYLSKMVMFSSELAEESADILAAAVVFIALKTLEQVDPSAEPQRYLPQICSLLSLQEQKTIEASRKVLDLAKNFSKYYPSLTNLKKFNKFEYGSN